MGMETVMATENKEDLYEFRTGLLCFKSDCECNAYDSLIFSGDTYMPPLHEGCDCYANRLQTIREKLEGDQKEDSPTG